MVKPRLREKTVQAHVVRALRMVGGTVYVLGTVHRGEPGHMSTRMTPGLPDLLVFLPACGSTPCHQLWVEVKAPQGRLSEAQKGFRDVCVLSGVAHLVGGLDEVLAYLLERDYLTEVAHYRRIPKFDQGATA